MDKKEAAKVIAVITSSYPAGLLPVAWTGNPERTVELFVSMLGDLPFEIVRKAITQHIQTSNYPPLISDIRRLCTKTVTDQYMTPDEAWGKLIQVIAKHGTYGKHKATEELEDEILKKIVKNVGYETYCLMPTEKASTYFAQFRDMYNAYLMSNIIKARTTAGLVTGENEVRQIEEELKQGKE